MKVMVQWAPFCCQEIKVVIKLVYYLDKKIFRNKFRPDLAVVGCRASTDTFLSLACFEIKGNPQKKKNKSTESVFFSPDFFKNYYLQKNNLNDSFDWFTFFFVM